MRALPPTDPPRLAVLGTGPDPASAAPPSPGVLGGIARLLPPRRHFLVRGASAPPPAPRHRSVVAGSRGLPDSRRTRAGGTCQRACPPGSPHRRGSHRHSLRLL